MYLPAAPHRNYSPCASTPPPPVPPNLQIPLPATLFACLALVLPLTCLTLLATGCCTLRLEGFLLEGIQVPIREVNAMDSTGDRAGFTNWDWKVGKERLTLIAIPIVMI